MVRRRGRLQAIGSRQHGPSLPSTVERFEWLEDTLQLAQRMWSGDDAPFVGTAPAPRGRSAARHRPLPHPPILIGGTGETKTLRLVARYGDACNLPDIPDGGALIRHKLAVLAEHCEAEGRSFDQIDKTVSTRLQPGESATRSWNGRGPWLHSGSTTWSSSRRGRGHRAALDTLAPPFRRSTYYPSPPSITPTSMWASTMRSIDMTDIEDFLDTWAAAEREGDAATTDRLLTDDFVGIGPVGFQLPKPAWLQRQIGGDLHYDDLSLDEITTRGYGDCAITTARWNAHGTAAEGRSPRQPAPRWSP